MKKNLLLLIALCCVASLYAQNNEKRLANEEFFTQADIVFEGRYLKTVDIYDSKGNDKYNSKTEDCYSINAYVVQRMYKGPKYNEGDIIYIVSQGGWLGAKDNLDWYSGIGFNESSIGVTFKNGINCGLDEKLPAIHFLVHSDFPNDVNSKYASYEKYKFLTLFYDFSKDYFPKLFICQDKIIGLDSLFFHEREDFYNYIKQFKGFTVPESISLPEEQIENGDVQQIIIDSTYDKAREESKDIGKKHKKKVPQNPKVTNYIFGVEIKNQQKVCLGGKCYLTFDVMVSDNGNEEIYFHRASVCIKYNTAIFGTKIKENAKLTVTRGELFGPTTNVYTTEILDLSANNTFYSESPCAYNSLKNYDQVIFTPTALPAITNLSPTSIVAGTDQTLTITGTNFGTQRGTVCFKGADDGGANYLKGLDEQYYVTPNDWSNTQIKVKVPSYVSKTFQNDTTKMGGAG